MNEVRLKLCSRRVSLTPPPPPLRVVKKRRRRRKRGGSGTKLKGSTDSLFFLFFFPLSDSFSVRRHARLFHASPRGWPFGYHAAARFEFVAYGPPLTDQRVLINLKLTLPRARTFNLKTRRGGSFFSVFENGVGTEVGTLFLKGPANYLFSRLLTLFLFLLFHCCHCSSSNGVKSREERRLLLCTPLNPFFLAFSSIP